MNWSMCNSITLQEQLRVALADFKYRTSANDSNSGTIEGPFFSDMVLHQWIIGSHCFEGVYCPHLQELIGTRLEMRVLCSLIMLGFSCQLTQLPVLEE